ncbi:SCO family protein [Ideonella sp.]|uniref:SCO family protein n=1 Tax=Ideonella sp. TaxID=1929293 RepID=UPI0035B2996C
MNTRPATVHAPALATEVMARRVSALLCLSLMAVLVVGLAHWTHGFEVWTFEGRRQAQVQAGELRARPVLLRASDGSVLRWWGDADAAPAASLVAFVYTRCPSVCRVLGDEYQQMQRELATRQGAGPTRRDVRLVSISFDAEHDDPAQLARYAANMRIDPRYWTLAVPATHDDASALLRSLGVVVVPDGAGGFVHNGAIHLLDERGRLRGLYEFDQWPQALEAAQRLALTRPEASR